MKNKAFFITGILAVLGLILYFTIRRKGVKAATATTDNTKPATTTGAITDREPTNIWPLQRNKTVNNKYLKEIQAALNDKYGEDLPLTGNFYAMTEAALKRHGLPTTISMADWYNITRGPQVQVTDSL